ncbi:thymidylate synthase [Streptomyces sp. NPDC001793]|uniref:thymidylate synthase n=1 Tax=Streptomyces sp. NPDC001793 TaxID=3154657 RepID=UPI00332F45C4
MSPYDTFAQAYAGGLESILSQGAKVPSVRDPLSKASGFGGQDRPYRELLAHTLRIGSPRSCLAWTPLLPVHLPYCFGLAAWSLDGRDDVGTPAYYRRGAYEYSDDQHTLSGAFGRRLLAAAEGNQLEAIIERIRRDPAHRRTFAVILNPADNFTQSREHPCAAGVQLFLRDGALTWITVMRAQQALTVLPYDAFLFMVMHQVAAALLDAACGPYIHQSGTFHVYENEIELAGRLISQQVAPVELPALPGDPDDVRAAVRELVDLERGLRTAVDAGDGAAVDRFAATKASFGFTEVARACLTTFAYRKLGDAGTVVDSPAVTPAVADLIAAI